MARFEVSQASVQRWARPQGDKGLNGVFLEVYLDRSAKSSCLFFRRSKARECSRFRTRPVEECDEMQWRTYNEEGFLVSLTSFVMPRSRNKKGEKLTLAVDAFRTSTSDISGTHVASFRGVLCLGEWGPVTLQAIEGKGLDACLQNVEVVLETRPTSSRPFSLECARPHIWERHSEPFVMVSERCYPSQDAEGRHGQAAGGGRRIRATGLLRALVRRANHAHRDERERIRPAQPPAVECSPQKRAGRSNLALTLSLSSGASGSAASSADSVFASRLSQRVSLDSPLESQATWKNLLRLVPSRRQKEVVADAFQQWIPQDLNAMWKQVWPQQLIGASGDIEVPKVEALMEAEFRRDCIVLFNTLFPRAQGSNFASLRHSALAPSKFQHRGSMRSGAEIGFASPDPIDSTARKEVHSTSLRGSRLLAQPSVPFIDDYPPRIMFLKRLLIAFAACGVYYSEAPNPGGLGDLWPYPLASLLGHGSRILVRLEDVEPSEFLNFLLTGDQQNMDWKESGIPRPLQRRMAATHAVEITDTGQLVERKLRVTNAAESVQNISDGIRGKHLGLNLPIGGVGNPSPMGPDHIIGFHGEVLRGPDRAPSGKYYRWGRSELGNSMNQASITSIGSDASCATSRSAIEGWRIVNNLQSGHLYVRTDDFGEVAVPAMESGGGSSSSPGRKEMRRALRERPTMDILPIEQARMKLKVESQTSEAGELFFPCSVACLHTPSRDDSSMVHGDSIAKFKLIRVRSEPPMSTRRAIAASPEDVNWVHEAMLLRFVGECYLPPPPSENALRSLLEDYDPLNIQLFGSGRFKSTRDLYAELTEQTSYLRWADGQLERHCEPVILQLCWARYVLMKTHEHVVGKDAPVQKTSFIATRLLPHEGWRMALRRVVESELMLPMAQLLDSLEASCQCEAACHTTVQETSESPSFPGLRCDYKTHMVRWTIREEAVEVFRSHGLPLVTDGSINGNLDSHGSEFMTMKTVGGRRKIYWRWLPSWEAQKLQRFINIGEATADERWARYAFRKEGEVQFPPTEAALAILFHRCGVDVDAFGQKGQRTLHDLWLELTNEESHLQMNGGRPLRVVEVLVLRLQWRPTPSDNYRIMVEVRLFKGQPSPVFCRRLPSTHKRKEETWIDSAVRLLEEDMELHLGPHQVRNLLTSKAGDRTECSFREERVECEDLVGVECLRRTHLVTCTLREDAAASPVGRALGLRSEEVPSERIADSLDVSTSWLTNASMTRPWRTSTESTTSDRSAFKAQVPCVEWLDAVLLKDVLGSEFWEAKELSPERKRVASVLLGLEGTAPGMKSPFGVEHEKSGRSAEISALGNRKWRCYRALGALQIPSEVGGLQTCITRPMFEDLMETCERLDLANASVDLLVDPKQGHPRWVVDQRFAERELFKRLLAGSGREAKETLAWMDEYRVTHRTPGRAQAAMRWRSGAQHRRR